MRPYRGSVALSEQQRFSSQGSEQDDTQLLAAYEKVQRKKV